jgi:hypothetical protein
MMKNIHKYFFAAGFSLILLASSAQAQAFIDVEGGVAFTGYNDVAIPADTGSTISLKNDISSDPARVFRMRIGYTFRGRHMVSVLIVFLTVYGSGTLDKDSTYQGKTFAAGSSVKSTYRFDSYRLTYRYDVIDSDNLVVSLGLTAKIRSADIAIMDDSGYAHRSDLGVVPLINFGVRWDFARPFSVLVDGDALASPYGRAEDVLVALQYSPSERVDWRLGYRILEGGSDGGGDVYTFALFNYVMAGLRVTF